MTAEGHESGYVNKQVWIQSKTSPDIFAILFHVNLLDVFPDYWNDYPPEFWEHHGADDTDYERLTVSSGEVIGYADLRGTISDIAILKKVSSTEHHYLSYFDDVVMTEPVFALHQQRGLDSRDDVIVSREFRNANPLPADCWGGRREEDWVRLTKAANDDEGVAGESSDEVFRVSLEEPINGQIHMGVGNLRGWAIGEAGIEKVEIWIDDVYAFDVPYGGSRGDVGMRFQMYPALENQAIPWRLPTQISLLVIIPLRPLRITPTGWWRTLHRSRSRSLRKALSLIPMRSI